MMAPTPQALTLIDVAMFELFNCLTENCIGHPFELQSEAKVAHLAPSWGQLWQSQALAKLGPKHGPT
eukprot:4421469-Karenia_brevis.AAC.1